MIVDLFAGFGWSEGLRSLGLSDVGLELDGDACRSRIAGGHATVRCDVAAYPPERFAGYDGLIASPPCQDFSVAGSRLGRRGARGELIDVVPRWVEAIRPRWIACEQVPPCLEIWQEHAAVYRRLGYSTWCGVLNAADYGVPQTRQRAFLMASLDRPAHPPEPTHSSDPAPTLFGPTVEPWVTMAAALGWGLTERPSNTMVTRKSGGGSVGEVLDGGSGSRRMHQRERERGAWAWPWTAPATTVAGDPRISARCHHFHGMQGTDARTTAQVERGDYAGTEPIRLGIGEALILQSFRPDYPLVGNQGSRFQQVGNAVPPVLAARVVGSLTGRR